MTTPAVVAYRTLVIQKTLPGWIGFFAFVILPCAFLPSLFTYSPIHTPPPPPPPTPILISTSCFVLSYFSFLLGGHIPDLMLSFIGSDVSSSSSSSSSRNSTMARDRNTSFNRQSYSTYCRKNGSGPHSCERCGSRMDETNCREDLVAPHWHCGCQPRADNAGFEVL